MFLSGIVNFQGFKKIFTYSTASKVLSVSVNCLKIIFSYGMLFKV